MRSSSYPLVVAASAFLIGGATNVAFVLHDGEQSDLIFFRFLFGVAVSGLIVLVLRRRGGGFEVKPAGRRRLFITCWAAFEAISIVFYISAAEHVGVVGVTAASLLAVPLLAVLGRGIGLSGGGWLAGLFASLAVLSAAAISLRLPATPEVPAVEPIGVLLLAGWLVFFIAGTLLNGKLGRGVAPFTMVFWVSCVGLILVSAMSAARGDNPFEGVSVSTLLAALFVALAGGTVAKAAVVWATGRTAPYLVTAASGASLITAGLGAAIFVREPISLWTVVLMVVVAVSIAGMAFSISRRANSAAPSGESPASPAAGEPVSAGHRP